MHGRKRRDYKARLQDETISKGLAQKAQQWHALSQQLMTAGEETQLRLLETLLRVNPDPGHLWNHRRQLLRKKKENLDYWSAEQNVTAACLQKNPKAYGAWFHRKWCLRHHLQTSTNTFEKETLQQELELCATFLLADERNFHCWNYRRFVVAALALPFHSLQINRQAASLNGSWSWTITEDLSVIMGPQITSTNEAAHGYMSDTEREELKGEEERLLENEWEYTTEKIMQNFSNCSAFHYRSELLPLICRIKGREKWNLLDSELELVQNAIFTDPDDQTAWWYLRFVVAWSRPTSTASDMKKQYQQMLLEQCQLIRELNEECKWSLLGLHMLLTTLMKTCEDDKVVAYYKDEARECLEKLCDVDPDRSGRYKSMMQTMTDCGNV